MTNQRCLAAGLISHDMRHQIHERIRDLLRARGTDIEVILVCPRDDHDDCGCRKPKSELLYQAAHKHAVCLLDSILIGGLKWGIVAGQTASGRTILILLGRTPGDHWAHVASITAISNFKTLLSQTNSQSDESLFASCGTKIR